MIFNGKLNSTTKRRFLSITIAFILIGTGIYIFKMAHQPSMSCMYDGMYLKEGDRHPQSGRRCIEGSGWTGSWE